MSDIPAPSAEITLEELKLRCEVLKNEDPRKYLAMLKDLVSMLEDYSAALDEFIASTKQSPESPAS